MIVAGAVIQEPAAILLPARVFVTVRAGESGLAGKAEGLIGVLGLQRAGVVTQCHRGAERIGQDGAHAHAIRSREELIDAQSGEQIRRDRGAVLFLHRIEPIVDKVGRGALNGFPRSAPKGIIGKAGGEPCGAETGQLIAHVPAVGARATRICHGVQVTIQVIGERIGPKDLLLIVRIVGRGGERRRQVRSRKRPPDRGPPTGGIVGVGQIPQNRGSLLVRETRQVIGVVIAVHQAVAGGIADTDSAIGVQENTGSYQGISRFKSVVLFGRTLVAVFKSLPMLWFLKPQNNL